MKLWLQGADKNKKVQGVRALRRLAASLKGGELEGSITVPYAELRGAMKAWDDAVAGKTMLLMVTDDPARMEEAMRICEDGKLDVAQTGDDEFPPNVRELPAKRTGDEQAEAIREEAAERPMPSYQAAQVGTLLVVAGDGNPSVALSFANTLANILDGDDLWAEVIEFITDTFPSEQELARRKAERQQ